MFKGRKLVSRATWKAGDMAQWLKLLAAFPEYLSLIPSPQVKSTGETQTGRPLGLLARQPSLIHVSGPVRDLVSQRWMYGS